MTTQLDKILAGADWGLGQSDPEPYQAKAKQQIKDLMLGLADDIDPLHTAEWYVKFRQKVEEL